MLVGRCRQGVITKGGRSVDGGSRTQEARLIRTPDKSDESFIHAACPPPTLIFRVEWRWWRTQHGGKTTATFWAVFALCRRLLVGAGKMVFSPQTKKFRFKFESILRFYGNFLRESFSLLLFGCCFFFKHLQRWIWIFIYPFFLFLEIDFSFQLEAFHQRFSMITFSSVIFLLTIFFLLVEVLSFFCDKWLALLFTHKYSLFLWNVCGLADQSDAVGCNCLPSLY